MVFLNPLSKRFSKPCTCSPNIGCFWLYVTNATVAYVMPFWIWILVSNVQTICKFNIRWKHICVQTWKQSTHESKAHKNHMFLQTRCKFSVRTVLYPHWLCQREHNKTNPSMIVKLSLEFRIIPCKVPSISII